MADSVGQIGLDLVVNQGQFNKQMKGIQGIAKKAGAALAGAFAVKKIVDFAAQCIELGSDLQEVQNVVDVTFPKMSRQVDEFAKNAAASFGLSETMAKRFTGTFGAMAKAFGFSEQAAYEMSTTLTGLAGDVASFYNISQDEAYTKLKSVFTGETESLKDLGVVMTQSALDAYALANGYDKTTKSMSEMEKVALRYQFVQDQLSASSGDFIRTSDSWANQVRVLKLQIDSLKATIGQGLINVLTPVIKVINIIIGKLLSLANAFKAFTEMITGKKGSGGAASAAGDMNSVADSADKAGAAMGGAGSAAKKAAKDIKTATTGIDELNILNPDTGSGSGSGGAGGYDVDDFDMGSIDTSAMDEMDSKYQKLIDKAKELKDLFVKGFWDGFGDTSVFDSIAKSIDSIKNSLKDIFLDPEVIAAAEGFADAVAYNLGRVAGSVASIGATIADNLLGGIAIFLEQNTDRIKGFLISMFDIGAEIATMAGDFSSAVAEIFTAFRSDSAKQITADIIGIFSSAFMGTIELAAKFGRDVLNVLTKPIIDNKDSIKALIEGILSGIQPIISKLKTLIDGLFDGLNTAYDSFVKPVLDGFAQGLSDVIGWLTVSEERFATVTLVIAAFFAAWQVVKLGEFIINAGGVVGALTAMITPLTTLTRGLLTNTTAFVANTAAKIVDKAETAAIVALYAKDFVVGIAQGTAALVKQAAQFAITTAAKIADTTAQIAMTAATVAWNAVCTIATTVTTALGAAITFLTSPIGLVILAITALIAAGVLLYQHWDTVKQYALMIWNSIVQVISDAVNKIKNAINAALNVIKTAWNTAWNAILTVVRTIWDNIFGAITEKVTIIQTAITGFIDGMKLAFSGLTEFIAGVFTGDWERAWNGVKDIFKGIFNAVISLLEGAMNYIVSGINKVLGGLNKVAGAIGELTGLNLSIPTIGNISLPRLAQGGFVRANTPQLAMIGDNRHYGEIVAPEDKMQEMVDRAVAMASKDSTGMSDYYLEMMVDLLQRIIEIIEQMDLTVTIDIRDIKKKLADLDKRSGYTLRTT